MPAALAQAAEDDIVIPNQTAAEHVLPLLGKRDPGHIFHRSAAIADEMVMGAQRSVEAGGFAVGGNFANQTGMGQGAQTVVHGCPG